MDKTAVLITGSTGFIGSNVLKSLESKNFFTVPRKINENTFSFINPRIENIQNFKSVVLLHLATHYSKSIEENDLIYKGNIDFGLNLLDEIKNLNIKKIVYTNTMFSYYMEEEIRELFYTKTKNQFSDILNRFSIENNIKYEEIYLDNTFGYKDNRKKIIPIIIESILKGNKNPVQNLDTFINAIYVGDVVKRIEHSLYSEDMGKTCFIENKKINISSIYKYLFHYFESKNINPDILEYENNNYLSTAPKIDYKNIQRVKFEDALINCFKASC